MQKAGRALGKAIMFFLFAACGLIAIVLLLTVPQDGRRSDCFTDSFTSCEVTYGDLVPGFVAAGAVVAASLGLALSYMDDAFTELAKQPDD